MNPTTRQAAYLTLSVLGAALTWKHNIEWMKTLDATGLDTLAQFWTDAFATPVSASLAWDVVIVATAGFVFVLTESLRLKMRWWPLAYVVLANGIAAAFAFPLFLFFRERKLLEGSPP